MCHGIVRLNLELLAEFGYGLLQIAALQGDVADVVMNLGIIRIGRQDTSKLLERIVEFAATRKRGAKVGAKKRFIPVLFAAGIASHIVRIDLLLGRLLFVPEFLDRLVQAVLFEQNGAEVVM